MESWYAKTLMSVIPWIENQQILPIKLNNQQLSTSTWLFERELVLTNSKVIL